jgi:hypothetical protein
MKKLTVLAAGTALLATLAACSSSSTTSATSTHSATASAAPKSGTETLTGQVTGAAAVANTTTFHLKFTGPVNTTGTFTPPNSNATSQPGVVFKTQAGNMVVNATLTSNPNAAPKMVNAAQCRFAFVTRVDYTIDGAKSTGSFAGATGSGKATVTFTADAPKLSSGQCNMSQNAQPLAKGAVGIFYSSGPLTLK